MALTKGDLQQISSIIGEAIDNKFSLLEEKLDKKLDKKFRFFLSQMMSIFVTKDEFYDELKKFATKAELRPLQGAIANMNRILGIEYPLQQNHLNDLEIRMGKQEQEIMEIKEYLHMQK